MDGQIRKSVSNRAEKPSLINKTAADLVMPATRRATNTLLLQQHDDTTGYGLLRLMPVDSHAQRNGNNGKGEVATMHRGVIKTGIVNVDTLEAAVPIIVQIRDIRYDFVPAAPTLDGWLKTKEGVPFNSGLLRFAIPKERRGMSALAFLEHQYSPDIAMDFVQGLHKINANRGVDLFHGLRRHMVLPYEDRAMMIGTWGRPVCIERIEGTASDCVPLETELCPAAITKLVIDHKRNGGVAAGDIRKGDIYCEDVTERVEKSVRAEYYKKGNRGMSIARGEAVVSVAHTTVAIVIATPDELNMMIDELRNVAPQEYQDHRPNTGFRYNHNRVAGDINGASHVQAGLLGSFEEVSLVGGTLVLDPGQRIWAVDCDTQLPRHRLVVVAVHLEEPGERSHDAVGMLRA